MIREINFKGLKMFIDDEDRIGNMLAAGKVYEKTSLKAIRPYIKKRTISVDIGAHIGYYTLLLSEWGKKVYAIEPDKINYSLLVKNTQNLSNVETFNFALSDFNGMGNLYLSGKKNQGDHRLFQSAQENRMNDLVKVMTFDSVFFDISANFIKIDTQGNELKILKGAKNSLRRSNADLNMLVEFWPWGLKLAGDDPMELIDFIYSYGYKIIIITRKIQIELSIKTYRIQEFIDNLGNDFVNLLCIKGG